MENKRDILPSRVVGEIKGINASRMPLKIKCTHNLSELSRFRETNLPHLHIRGKATGSNKPLKYKKVHFERIRYENISFSHMLKL